MKPAPRLPSTRPPCSRRTWILCRPSLTIRSLTYRGAATIKCRSTCSRLSRKTKLWQPANVSTPRSATDPACDTASPKPPLPSRVPSRTSLSTTTSPLISSAFRRNSLGRALRLLRGQALWLRRVSAYSQRERFAHRPSVEKGSLLLSLHPG